MPTIVTTNAATAINTVLASLRVTALLSEFILCDTRNFLVVRRINQTDLYINDALTKDKGLRGAGTTEIVMIKNRHRHEFQEKRD